MARELLAVASRERELEVVAERSLELLDADQALLARRVDGETRYSVLRNWRPGEFEGKRGRLSRTIVDEALRLDQLLLVSDATADPRFQDAPSVMALKVRSVLVAPLTTARGERGALYLERAGPGFEVRP